MMTQIAQSDPTIMARLATSSFATLTCRGGCYRSGLSCSCLLKFVKWKEAETTGQQQLPPQVAGSRTADRAG